MILCFKTVSISAFMDIPEIGIYNTSEFFHNFYSILLQNSQPSVLASFSIHLMIVMKLIKFASTYE